MADKKMWKNVVNYIGCDAEYEEARIVLYGAPFDSTTSFRPGTRFAGQAIRNDSYGLEIYSPYQDRELAEGMVYDCGDLELAIGNSEAVLAQIEETAAGKLPFMIGGEHLVTLGAVRAAVKRYPELHIIHFDAHTDLRTDYLGVELSHACVMRRCWEVLGDGGIHQFGIRSGEKQEFDWAKSGHTDFHPFRLDGLWTFGGAGRHRRRTGLFYGGSGCDGPVCISRDGDAGAGRRGFPDSDARGDGSVREGEPDRM